jgi:hypothetical protein
MDLVQDKDSPDTARGWKVQAAGSSTIKPVAVFEIGM